MTEYLGLEKPAFVENSAFHNKQVFPPVGGNRFHHDSWCYCNHEAFSLPILVTVVTDDFFFALQEHGRVEGWTKLCFFEGRLVIIQT